MIKPSSRLGPLAVFLAIAFLSEAKVVLGCVLVASEFMVGPDFVVSVKNAGEPVNEIAVEILKDQESTERELVLRGKTGVKGEFRVRGLAPGKYFLRVGTGTPFIDSAFLGVKPVGTRGIQGKVQMAWPPGPVLRTVRFRGVLREQSFDAKKERFVNRRLLNGEGIEVRDGRSQQVLVRTTTNADGSFDIGKLSPGIYVVDFADGEMALQVVEGKDRFPNGQELGISFTSCGLSFAASPLPPEGKKEVSP